MNRIILSFKSYERYVKKLEWLFNHYYEADTWVKDDMFYIQYWRH